MENNQSSFKKIADLTLEERKTLDKCRVQIKVSTIGKGLGKTLRATYVASLYDYSLESRIKDSKLPSSCHIHFNDSQDKNYFTLNQYEAIKLLTKQTKDESFSIDRPYRLVKKVKDGKEFVYIQIIIYSHKILGNLIVQHLLSDTELSLMKLLISNKQFEERVFVLQPEDVEEEYTLDE